MRLAAVLLAFACLTAVAQRPQGQSTRADDTPGVQNTQGADETPGTQDDGSSPQVTITATGDVLLHIKVNKAAARHGWARLFESMRPLLPESHIAFANLETPLVDDVNEVVTGSPPVLGSRPEAAPALADAGFDVLGCANNHAFDQQSEGTRRTLEAIAETSLISVGSGVDRPSLWRPRIVERAGVRVAFLAVTDGMNRGPGRPPVHAHVASLHDEVRLTAAIRDARQMADVVVLSVHWSYDYAPVVSRRQRRWAREWIALGVDYVLGSGPHILQHVERVQSERGDAIIAYSLGNFISNQGQRWAPGRRIARNTHPAVRLPATRDGVLLHVTFHIDDGRLRLDMPTATPLFTENNYWAWWNDRSVGHDIRVVALADADPAVRAARLGPIREALGPLVRVEDTPPREVDSIQTVD